MEIVLTYRGRIPSKRSDKEAVWDMRMAFHKQLLKLWGKEPFRFLKDWEDQDFPANAPDFRKHHKNQLFIPLFGQEIGVGIGLDITLLTGTPNQLPIVKAGDLDNRIKRIIDALQAPQNPNELSSDFRDPRVHCLIHNDDAVLDLSAHLRPYLDSSDQTESFAFIRVRPIAMRVTMKNLAILS